MSMSPEQLEKDFQKEVVAYARLNGWRCYSVPDSRRISELGFPDLFLWSPSRKAFLFAELKREKGKLRPDQIRVHAELIALGLIVFVWRPSDWDQIKTVLGRPRKTRKVS